MSILPTSIYRCVLFQNVMGFMAEVSARLMKYPIPIMYKPMKIIRAVALIDNPGLFRIIK